MVARYTAKTTPCPRNGSRLNAYPAVALVHGVGPALVLACLGLVLALVRRNRADLALASFVLVYFADLLTLNAHFDRYTLPLVPALGVLAGRLRSLTPVTLLLLIVPLTWSIREARALIDRSALLRASIG